MSPAGLSIVAVAAFVGVLEVAATRQDPPEHACRAYPPRAMLAEVKAHVEALRRIEREAADRRTGLDTRPYDWLLGQAQTAETAISIPALVEAEEKLLDRCFVPPLRTTCSIGAAALVRVIKELVAGEASDEARMAFAQRMPHCERTVGLKPSDTTLRAFKWPPGPADNKPRTDPPR
jgi:hypothetical protein